jgi:hypothetical protein
VRLIDNQHLQNADFNQRIFAIRGRLATSTEVQIPSDKRWVTEQAFATSQVANVGHVSSGKKDDRHV